MVTNMLPTPDDPGLGVFVKSQIDSIAAAGHEVSTLWIDRRRSAWNYAHSTKRLNQMLREKKYDIVHAHYGLSGVPACMQRHCPVVVSFCGDDLLGAPNGKGGITPKSRATVWASQVVAHVANAVIVKSDEMVGRITSAAARHKTVVIPNGVDLDFFRPMDKSEARREEGLDENRRYVLFPSSPNERRKRLDLAREAVELLRATGPDVELVVLHRKPQEFVPVYMNACDVVLLTSDWEGSSNVVKEALACNSPVVAVDAGDAWRLIDGVSQCFKAERDPRDIAEKLGRALDAGARSDGRERIDHLELGAVAQRVIAVYEGVLSNK
jgi:teichuronic acid biosynthesis glycosyltransferase TuaC